jgi:TolA-binding protein
MKKIRLTESELTELIKNIVNETQEKEMKEEMENYFNPEAMETGEAIVTIIGTVIGMLGIAGSHYIKAAIKKLRKSGNDAEADKVESALEKAMQNADSDPSGMGNVMKKRYEMDMKQIKDEEKNNSSMMESRIVRRRR